jgi:hypothetical protein
MNTWCVDSTSDASVLTGIYQGNVMDVHRAMTTNQMIFEAVEAVQMTGYDPNLGTPGGHMRMLGNVTGQKTGEPLPNYVAALVRLTAGYAGRNNRGRMFLFGFVESDNIGNYLSPQGQTDVQAYINAFTLQFPVTTGPNRLMIQNRQRTFFDSQRQEKITEFFSPFDPNSYRQVSGIGFATLLATMRSRKVGRGI